MKIAKKSGATLCLLTILSASCLMQMASWSNGQNWGDDFASYIMQAKSIGDGRVAEFIRLNSFTVEQSTKVVGPIAYPWLFPISLAIANSLAGMNLFAFKTAVLIFNMAFLVTVWVGFSRRLSNRDRILLVTIFAFNPYFIEFSDNILSDIPFLFISTLTVLAVEKFLRELDRSTAIWPMVVLGLLFFASSATRSNGILLPFTYLFLMTVHSVRTFCRKLPPGKGWRDRIRGTKSLLMQFLIPLLVFLVCAKALELSTSQTHGSYLKQLQPLSTTTVAQNVFYYAVLLRDFFGPPPIGGLLYVLSIPIVIVGLRADWKSSVTAITYSAFTLLLFIIWPYQEGLRFIFPILPFYVYFLVVGLRILAMRSTTQLLSKLFKVLVLSYFLTSSAVIAYIGVHPVYGPYAPNSQEMLSFVRDHVPKDDVVVFHKPRAMRLLTGRMSVAYKTVDDFRSPEWYVVDKTSPEFGPRDLATLLKRLGGQKLFENSQFEVYQLRSPDVKS